MITSIYIENILLIEKININLKDNLTIILGETGSGKSILLESIGIALGDRAKTSILRDSSKPANIVIEFLTENNTSLEHKFEEFGMPFSKNLVIRKVITQTSSKIFINDIPTSLNFINSIRQHLIEIYSQFDQIEMLYENNHVSLIDRFIGESEIFHEVKSAFNLMKDAKKEYEFASKDIEKLKEKQELLEQMKIDLEELDLQENEELELIEKRKKAQNLSELQDKFNLLSQIFENVNISSTTLNIQKSLEKIESITGEVFKPTLDKVEDVYKQFIDIENDILKKRGILLESDLNIDSIEARLFEIQKVARKYKTTTENIPNLLKNAQKELDFLENATQILNAKKTKLEELNKNYKNTANKLSELRKQNSKIMSEKLTEKMKNLKLENAKLEFEFRLQNDTDFGIDDVCLMVSMNKGMQMQPINKSASGGELSRFMLALKSVISQKNNTSTMIFDEIDTGVSGDVAMRIGRELKSLSTKSQLLCITHNPQVAIFGKNYLSISKHHKNEQTETIINEIDGKNINTSIAKMIEGDNYNDNTIKLVESMINSANENGRG